MPRRKSRKSAKSTKSISNSNKTIGNDLTGGQFFPLVTSSPQAVRVFSSEEIGENAVLLKNSSKEGLLETFERDKSKLETNLPEENAVLLKNRHKEELLEKFERHKSKLETTYSEILSAADLCNEVTNSEIKTLQKLFAGISKDFNFNGSSLRRTTHTLSECSGLPAIPEEENLSPGSKARKIKFMTEKLNEDDSVFKKPRATAKGKRTLKTSQAENSLFRTPRSVSRSTYNVAMVTPGPNSALPISILRRPTPGEMAISMSGSPLLISHNNIPTNVPQISIPLSDGRVMTVLANEGLDPDMSICSDIDPETHEKLIILQKLLTRKTQKKQP